jgi:hypothetical protein
VASFALILVKYMTHNQIRSCPALDVLISYQPVVLGFGSGSAVNLHIPGFSID